jgi:protein phosphatase 1D
MLLTESKKRKAKDWEAEDYYDSDEDTFLDRTGTVEKKRQQRMRAAGKRDPGEVVETYDSLVSINQYMFHDFCFYSFAN